MWRRITIQQTAIVVIFLLVWAIASQSPVDSDMWWHLRQGEYTLSEQTIIRTDLFSHTLDATPSINASCLGQIIMVAFGQTAGPIGLMLFTSLCAVAGIAIVYRLMAGNVYLRGLILIIASSAAVIFWSPRPQMITFL